MPILLIRIFLTAGAVCAGPEALFASDETAVSSAGPIIVEDLFSRAYGKRLWDDTRVVLTAPAGWDRDDWTSFSAKTAAAGAAFSLDRPIRDAFRRNRNETTGAIAHRFEPFGTAYSFAALGGFYLAGKTLGDAKAKAVALDGLAASLIASGIVVPVVKTAVGRNRPSESEEIFHFRPFGGRRSFPSGHAAQAFAVASVIAAHYDSLWASGTAYGIAALAGLARVERGRHYASDVLAGGLIGGAIGRVVVAFNREERGRIAFGPILDGERRGAMVMVRF